MSSDRIYLDDQLNFALLYCDEIRNLREELRSEFEQTLEECRQRLCNVELQLGLSKESSSPRQEQVRTGMLRLDNRIHTLCRAPLFVVRDVLEMLR